MRKFAALLFVWLGTCVASAQVPSFMTQSQLYSFIGTQLPTNGNNLINAQQLRSVLDNMVASSTPAGGLSPIVSIGAYGGSGSSASLTGNMTNGSNVLQVTAGANDFVNGQGILIYGAAAVTAPQPTNLTVMDYGTPGTTTLTYTIASVQNGGVGIAVTPVAITNGPATLSNANYVELTWNVAAGAQSYVIWRKVGTGSYNLLGIFAGYYLGGNATFLDVGATPNGAFGWAPTTPPIVPVPGYLVTTVTSGAGTSNLQLAAAATASALSAYVQHDDTAAFRTALNAYAGMGVKFQLACNATYMISSEIDTNGPGQGYVGCGQGSTIIQAAARAQMSIMLGFVYPFGSTSHLTINGNRQFGGTLSNEVYTSGIYVINSGMTVDDTEVENVGFEGLLCPTGEGGASLVITNDYFHDNGDVGDIWGAGVSCIGQQQDVRIVNNKFSQNFGLTAPGPGGADVGGGAMALDMYSVTITNNWFYDNYNTGGQVVDSSTLGAQRNWNVNSNIFQIDNEPANSFTDGMELNGEFFNISNNVFSGGKGYAIVFNTGGGNTVMGLSSINGNIISKMGFGIGLLDDTTSGATGYTTDVNISGNIFNEISTSVIQAFSRTQNIGFYMNNYESAGGSDNIDLVSGVTNFILMLNMPNTNDTGVTFTGAPTSSFQSSGGVVTHQ